MAGGVGLGSFEQLQTQTHALLGLALDTIERLKLLLGREPAGGKAREHLTYRGRGVARVRAKLRFR
jgi:hypothetical protein